MAMLKSYNCVQEKIDFDGERIKCYELNQKLIGLELDLDKVKKVIHKYYLNRIYKCFKCLQNYKDVKRKLEEAKMTIQIQS